MKLSEAFGETFGSVQRSQMLSQLQLEGLNRKFYLITDVMKTLNDAGIECVLVGAQALSQHTNQPRATEDVDVVVDDHKLAVKAIMNKWPNLKPVDESDAVRIFDGEHVVIDILKPIGFYKSTLNNSQTGKIGNIKINIPTPEMAVVMKYAAFISPNRSKARKHQDVSDFISLVKAQKINDDKVAELVGSLYVGADKEVKDYLYKARNDVTIIV